MKKYILITIFAVSLLLGLSFESEATGAYPYPITVTQPDGSKITIRIHGDEFLSWITSNGKIVVKGKDGFYRPTGANAPSPEAFARAFARREQMSKSYGPSKISATSMSGQSISMGQKRFLVILIQFSDLKFTLDATTAQFSNLLNQSGYSANGGTGSVHDYYYDNSRGLFDPIFDVYGPVTVSKGYAYYGEHDPDGAFDKDKRPQELLAEACRLLDSEIDFSIYDTDGDGYVDNVFFYFAGHNEAEGAGEDHIWPHSWNIYNTNTVLDGVRIYYYACSSEYRGVEGTDMCGIGTFCHEFGHTIGLPDFYDTDYFKNGQAPALYNYSLMSSGNYNNNGNTPPYLTSIERNILGWMGEAAVIDEEGNFSLEGVSGNHAYRINTANDGEYYLFENRKDEKWDKYIGGFGMLVYHIDKSSNIVGETTARQRWLNGSGINSYAAHQCCDLVEAVPEKSVPSLAHIPFPGLSNNTSLAVNTTPALFGWDGKQLEYGIYDIDFSGEIVKFRVSIDTDNPDHPFYAIGFNAIDNPKTSYLAGETFIPKLIRSNKVPSLCRFFFDGNPATEETPITLTAGEHTIDAYIEYSNGNKEHLEQKITVK